ncbi:unnamed protein product [Heterobilharzia americana]|nr:unnamed protein product [Heterobilharzia americana]
MSNIDSYFRDFLDNEDGEKEQNGKSLQDMRSGVIFLIDCTPTMFGLHGSFNNDTMNVVSVARNGFDLSLLCCQTYQQNKALHSPFDMIGLVLMRTRLGLASSARILEIEQLRQLEPDELQQRFGTIVDQPNINFPLHEALWACQSLFVTCSKTIGIKHIFLLTDDPDPVNKSSYLKRRAMTKMGDLKQYGIELEVIPIKQQNMKFDYTLFYDELLEDETTFPDINPSLSHPDPTERLDELLSRNVLTKCCFTLIIPRCYYRVELPVSCQFAELRRSRVARLPFRLGPGKDFTLGVSVYCLIRSTRLPSPIWLSSNDNKPVAVQRRYYKVIDPYGSFDPVKDKLPPHDLVRGIKLDGRYVCFDKDELTEAVRNIAPVGIHLLGFTQMKFLKRFYYIRPAHFIYPDEKLIHGSRLWFTALLNRCLHRKLLAIAIYIQRKGQFPRLVALLPQAEQMNDDKLQTMPPGFHIIFLPYADDFRDIDIPISEIANESQVDIAKAMIPLNRESQCEVVDHTLPKIEVIKRRAGEEIEAFKRCFNLDNINPVKKSRSLQSTTDDDNNNSQVVKLFLSEDECRTAIKLGHLNKYTLPVLRETIKSFGLKLSNNNNTGSSIKKSDIIQQIIDHFK